MDLKDVELVCIVMRGCYENVTMTKSVEY